MKSWKKRGRRFYALLLCLCMLLLAAGCTKGGEEKEEGGYYMYYLSLAESSLEPEEYEPTGGSTESMVQELARLIGEQENSEEHMRLLPEGVEILSCSLEDGTVTVDFNEEYKKMKNTREILVRGGIVKSFAQLPGVTYVTFSENGSPMTDSNGKEIGLMNQDTFVENEGKNINAYTSSSMNLYFANKKGDRLVRETISKYYSSNVPLERVVLETLIKGPSSSDMQGTISPNTKILGVSIVEGICYVNLDKAFMSETMNVQEQIPIYSIVNSLTDACGVHGVQISVEGETKVTFRESMNLDTLYKADYSLVEEENEEAEDTAKESQDKAGEKAEEKEKTGNSGSKKE